ncbi:MAG: hypothetical protein ACKVU1_11875 [bacterium]
MRAPSPSCDSRVNFQRLGLTLTFVAFLFTGLACSGSNNGGPSSATAPTPPTTRVLEVSDTTIEGAPAFKVRWTGNDADGSVAGFEYALDEPANWTYTDLGEVVIPAGEPAAPGASASAIARALFVRSVDDAGLRDPNPLRLMLGGENALPVTTITRGPSGNGSVQIVGRNVRFDWTGEDSDGVVTGYRYQLDDEPWAEVGADCTYVRFIGLSTAQYVGDIAGFHAFQVVSVDDDGGVEQLIEETRNFRLWESVQDFPGNILITSNSMGLRGGVNNSIGTVFQGTHVAFEWRADASFYGGIIQCYEYAYDDPNAYSVCDLASTTYPPDAPDFIPPLGMHTLYVRAVDDFGSLIEGNFSFEVIAGPGGIAPAARRVLYVDDFAAGSGSSGAIFPTDATEDAFWEAILAGVPHSTFSATDAGDIPPRDLLGGRSTVIWYVDDESQLERANQATNYRNPLWLYVRAGGNVIVCGLTPTRTHTPDNFFDPIVVENPGCPHNPRNDYGGPESSLDWYPASCDENEHPVYEYLHARRSFYSGSAAKLASLGSASQLVPDLALDLSKRGNLPDGTPMLAAGLELCEQFDLRTDSGAIPLWRLVDVNGSEERVCGYWIPASEESGRGNVVVLGFAPYYFDTLEMREVFRTLLARFGQPIAIEE